MPPQIQHKRGTSSDIASVNPILLDGEIVFETDTKKFKFGDGSTSWNNLPYAVLPNSGVSISGINIISGSGNFNTLTVSSVPVSVSGHSHTSSNITNFNTAVSGLVSGIYAPLNSPSFSGIPTVPTASSGTNTNQIASTSFVRTEISNLVDSSPSTLDTLNELAAALGDDPNFATTITNLIGSKVSKSGDTMTGALIISPTGASPSGLIISPGSETNLQNTLTIDLNNYLTITNAAGGMIATEDSSIERWTIGQCEINGGSGNFASLKVNNTGVSISGHSHTSSDITNFNSSVSGLLPSNLVYTTGNQSVSGIKTFNESVYLGSSGNPLYIGNQSTSTTIQNVNEQLDIFCGNNVIITADGAGIFLNSTDLLWNNTQVSIDGHSHSSSDITDFNSSVSGLFSGIYQPLLTNPVTGVGTSGYLSRWNGTNSITSGIIFDNGSRIGIGTVAPSSLLHLIGDSYTQGALCISRTGTTVPITYNRLFVDNSESLLIRGGDNQINLQGQGGNIKILAFSQEVEIGNSYNAGTTNQHIRLSPAGTEKVRITNLGSVGIGTTTPSGQLHVVGTGIISSRIGIGTNSPTFDLDVRTNSDNAFYVAQGSGARFLSFGSTGFINNTTLSVSKSTWNSLATIELSTTAASRRGLVVEQVASQTANAIETRSNTATVLSYINSGGGAYFASNVGIGTSTPTRQLHVIGTGLIASTTGLPANALLDVYSTTSGEMVFNVEGTNGSLFSVIDNLSGSLMSVNNNAGLPIFEVFSDDSIIAGRFNQNDFVVSSGGNIGIGKALPSVKLDVVGTVAVSGAFSATTKSFKIDHPSKPDHTLEYGSLESPYHGVRLTGRDKVSKGICVVKLPSYLKDLIHNDDSINIQLTNLYHDKILYISKIDLSNNNFIVCAKRAKSLPDLEFCWTFTGIRKDVDLVVENIK